MKKVFFLLLLFLCLGACSKNESSVSSSSFDPTKSSSEDPLSLGGTGACKIDEKKDCDTPKK